MEVTTRQQLQSTQNHRKYLSTVPQNFQQYQQPQIQSIQQQQMEQNVVSILRSFCFEVDRIVDRHKSDEDILNFDFNINYQHHFDNQVQDYQQYQTFNQSSQDHSIQESDQKLHSHRTITNQGTGDKSNKIGKFGFKAKSKSPMRISHEVSNFNNYSQSRIQQTSGQALTQRARQVKTGSQTVQKAQNSREIKDEDQSLSNSNGKKLDAHEADLLVQRLYSYQSKTEAKIKLEQEKQEQQFKLEQPGVLQLQTTANESKFQSLKQRVPQNQFNQQSQNQYKFKLIYNIMQTHLQEN